MSKFSLFGKKGFGLIEVMAAAVVLGFLIVALTRLQMGNREAALRIRTRDAAQIVAQQYIDSLSSRGINSIKTSDKPNEPVELEYHKTYKWEGNGSITSPVMYTIKAKIKDEQESKERSNLTSVAEEDTMHVMAKKVDLTVSWNFRGSTQSISLSRIIK